MQFRIWLYSGNGFKINGYGWKVYLRRWFKILPPGFEKGSGW